MNMAYAARYGHQQVTAMLGRQMTSQELYLFCMCIEEWRKTEVPETPFDAGPGEDA